MYVLLLSLFFVLSCVYSQQIQAKLTGINAPELVKLFGFSVDIYGDQAIVGCRTCEYNGKKVGSVIVYSYANSVWTASQQLVASNGYDLINFGSHVKITDDYVLVGAPDAGYRIDRPGFAYVFEQSWDGVWYEAAMFQLDTSNGDKGWPYGDSIALCGDYAFVGCPECDATYDGFNHQVDSGLVDIYRRQNGQWTIWQKLRPLQITVSAANFGSDIDTDCDNVNGTKRAIIGAYKDRLSANIIGAGSALIYELDESTGQWTFKQKISYVTSQTSYWINDYFGATVAIDGDYVAVGAWNNDNDASLNYVAQESGSVYFWERNSNTGVWSMQVMLKPSELGAFDRISRYGISMYGKWCVATFDLDDDKGDNAGAVYVFERNSGTNQWGEYGKVHSYDAFAGDTFGISVAINGPFIIAGAIGEDVVQLSSGAAYIISNWESNTIQSYTEASNINIIKTPGRSNAPTITSMNPTSLPTIIPTMLPTAIPTNDPTTPIPTSPPTKPSKDPTTAPVSPSFSPTNNPTNQPIIVDADASNECIRHNVLMNWMFMLVVLLITTQFVAI